MGAKFPYKESTMYKRLGDLSGMAHVVLNYARTKASVIEADMKVERPWTDQTGAAKARLTAKVSSFNANIVRITLAHGVDYGVYLEGYKPDGTEMARYSGAAGELGSEKKHAIIAPTVKKFSAEIVEDLEGIMERV